MNAIVLLVGLALGSPPQAPECRNPPSRSSDSYWSYIEACGCGNLDPPPRASLDYDRYLRACSHWRERNPGAGNIAPGPSASPECRNPPSRSAASYWDFIDACGCANVDPPSKASPDHDRFLKACSQWRERNPRVGVSGPAGAKPSPAPPASPDTRPRPGPNP